MASAVAAAAPALPYAMTNDDYLSFEVATPGPASLAPQVSQVPRPPA
jgi:hypothetical protein